MPMSGRGTLRRGLRVTALVALGVVVILVTVAMLLLPPASPRRLVAGLLETGDPSFYAVPAATPAAAPGTPVRSEELLSAPDGTRAWRVLFHSTDLDGRDAVVSGVVVAPESSESSGPAGGRIVAGWGHPTTGATPPWSTLLAANTPGAPPSGLPVFVAQGGADTLVVPTRPRPMSLPRARAARE